MKSSFEWQLFEPSSEIVRADGSEHWYSPKFFGGARKDSTWKLELAWLPHMSICRSLKLHLVTSDVEEVRVRFEMSLQCDSHTILMTKKGVEVCKMSGNHVVEIPYFCTDKLFKITSNAYRATICIRCELQIESISERCNLKVENKGIPDFEQLLNDSEFSDITLETPSESFLVNKKILTIRSPVFRAMFDHDMKEKMENTISIPDVDPDVMRELLRFIYCGRAESFENVTDLFWAADKYQIDELKLKCLEILSNRITDRNAVEIYALAGSCSDGKSMTKASSYIVQNIKGILATSGFDSLKDDALLRNILLEIVVKYVP